VKLDIRSFSQCTSDGRCLEVWFSRNVTDDDRANLLAAINAAGAHADLVQALEAAEEAYKALVGRSGYEQYQALEDKATELRRAALAKAKALEQPVGAGE
jgi:AmiR/NasT family two-component response regulator